MVHTFELLFQGDTNIERLHVDRCHVLRLKDLMRWALNGAERRELKMRS